jgi:hypothetical protein
MHQNMLRLIHSDLTELLTRSYHGYKWFILFMDDLTSHAWIINLKAKSNAASAMHDFMAHIRTQHQAKLKHWWFDGGGEFKPMENELQKDGIVIEKLIPHEQQQNGHAEHLISTIMDKAQAIHFTAELPQSWWEFCVKHGLYLYNKTPIKHTMWKTPYENLMKTTPDVSNLRIFGCTAYVFLPEEVQINKLNPKSELMTFISFQTGIKGY